MASTFLSEGFLALYDINFFVFGGPFKVGGWLADRRKSHRLPNENIGGDKHKVD